MDRQLPPLVALRAFEAAARYQSMRRAADALSISHSVISRHVRNLEEWLGVELFDGSRRNMALTPVGQRYFNSITACMDTIARATEELRPQTLNSTLRVWCVPGLASRWLVPRLEKFRAAFPTIEIVLRPSGEAPKFDTNEADIFLSYGEVRREGLAETMLVHPRVFPVAGADAAAKYRVEKPGDLLGLQLLHEQTFDYWRTWFDACGMEDVPTLRGPRLWYANNAIDAAICGQGITLANELIVQDDLASGRLVKLLDPGIRLAAYYMYVREDRALNGIIARFKTWLLAELEASTPAESRPEALPA